MITSLINMYSKCRSIKKVSFFLYNMCNRQIKQFHGVQWLQAICKESITLFEQMECVVTNLDDIPFITILSSWSHAGLVKEGYQYFKFMVNYYHSIRIMNAQYMLLSHVGYLDEAKDFINNKKKKTWCCNVDLFVWCL